MDAFLYILQRYTNYLPTLAIMERNCFGNIDRLSKTIIKFFAPRIGQQEAEKLVDFAKMLYSVGLNFKRVNFDFSAYTDWNIDEEDETEIDYDLLSLDEIKERNRQTMYRKWSERTKWMHEYNVYAETTFC